MDKTEPEVVQVNILNQTYTLRCAGDRERVLGVARLVDERMRLASAHMTTHEVAKIAVVAALNIADELWRAKEQLEAARREAEAAPPDPAPEPEAEAEPARDAPGAGGARTWFEEILSADGGARRGGERLSSLVTEKLKATRQAGRGGGAPEAPQD